MGGCTSIGSSNTITRPDGNGVDFLKIYDFLEEVGRGQFAAVHKVRLHSCPSQCFAAKVMKKGVTFVDGVVHTPLSKEALSREVDILRVLEGKKNVVNLHSVFESPAKIFIVTELCAGGDLFTYLSSQRSGKISFGDLSWIGYQLLSAVDFCHAHHIMHRDIKPENIMFKHQMDQSPLKLIDFGCGCFMNKKQGGERAHSKDSDENEIEFATVFAGTPFYVAPEVFGGCYSYSADVWSIGVIMAVIMAGYPATDVQEAFDLMQEIQGRDLRNFPGMPSNLPEAYFDFLDRLLNVNANRRESTASLMKHDFTRTAHDFGTSEDSQQLLQAHGADGKKKRRPSFLDDELTQSIGRHCTYLNFLHFQTKAAVLIAASLTQAQLLKLLVVLEASTMGDLGIVTLWEVREALNSIGEVDLLEDFGQEGRTYNRYAFELAKLKNLVTNYAQVPVPKSPRNRNSTMVAGAGLGLPAAGNSAQFLNIGTEAGAKKFTKKKKFDLGGSVHGTRAFG
ncbi:hypothetical protein TrST_g10 [Triparma strigata]|uniref:Protein kinase domain-containing protein n=1 Tax=Triparma strigata TaxID=1606541 RepID=A0A9W7EC11_9STRA|nr:hypothetical protein TrST_g10 [Triparma strigata]